MGGFLLVYQHIEFVANHAMNWPTGGYPTLRRNELRDFTAETLSEVCTDVSVELSLQPLTGETFDYVKNNQFNIKF